MDYQLSNAAECELDAMDSTVMLMFVRHIEKITKMPPRKHLHHGNPHFVEKVTKGARFAYRLEGETVYVVRCFATHKEYENWYKQL